MRVYADTNFFTSLLLNLPFTSESVRLAGTWEQARAEPLPFTPLLKLEVTNALHRLVFESSEGRSGYVVSRASSLAAEASIALMLDEGNMIQARDVRSDVLEDMFVNLVHRHTAKHGFRTYDILHVASALLLGCDTFWSFDAKAKKLAKLEGLATN